jgi:hypothetical protein
MRGLSFAAPWPTAAAAGALEVCISTLRSSFAHKISLEDCNAVVAVLNKLVSIQRGEQSPERSMLGQAKAVQLGALEALEQYCRAESSTVDDEAKAVLATLRDAAAQHAAAATSCAAEAACMHCEALRAQRALCALPGCGVRLADGAPKLKSCTGCHARAYCGKEHQAAHWAAAHNAECRALRAAAAPPHT